MCKENASVPFRMILQPTALLPHGGALQHLSPPSLCVPSASGVASTACLSYNAQPLECGITSMTHTAKGSKKPYTPETGASPCAAFGSTDVGAMRSMTTCMAAPAVELSHMEPVTALKLRRLQPQTPYKAEAWESVLHQAGLIKCFPLILAGLQGGFIVGYLPIPHVQFPPNSTTISLYMSKFEVTVTPKTVPMFGSCVVHINWCM